MLGDATEILSNLLATIGALKEKYLDEGLKLIGDSVGSAIKYIKELAANATALGFDVTKCIVGREDQLENLATGLVGNLTGCVTDIISDALTMVNNDLKVVQQIVGNITAIPAKLTKCLISLRPITCVTNLIGDLTTALANIPGQVLAIIKEATNLVDNLPNRLEGCVANIATSILGQVGQIVTDVSKCIDDVVSGGGSTKHALVARTTKSLIDDINKLITGLQQLLSGTIGDALETLGNLVSVITTLKKKFLDEGIKVITGIIGDTLGYIANMTQLGIDMGIDFAVCLGGRVQQVEKLGEGLIVNVTDCVGTVASRVLVMVNKDLAVINQMVGNITNAPVKLAKCLISLRPISCLTNLLGDLTSLLANIPGQIVEIVKNAKELVEALPGDLTKCVDNIVSSTLSQTEQIVKDIGNCIDDLISQNTTAAPTAAPTAKPPM